MIIMYTSELLVFPPKPTTKNFLLLSIATLSFLFLRSKTFEFFLSTIFPSHTTLTAMRILLLALSAKYLQNPITSLYWILRLQYHLAWSKSPFSLSWPSCDSCLFGILASSKIPRVQATWPQSGSAKIDQLDIPVLCSEPSNKPSLSHSK